MIPRLGVGLLYNPSLPDFLRSSLDEIDYLEVTPDMFWTDLGPGREPRFVELEGWIDVLDWVAARRPIIAHHTQLSLGTADFFDTAHLERIAEWHRRFGFPWHSDHLSFVRTWDDEGREESAALAVPVPFDADMLELVASRVDQIRMRVPIPFLVENSTYFVRFPDQDMSETEFLNQLCSRSGCGLLLDVHNLYANSLNHGFDAFGFLDQLDLNHVLEVHIAGGSEMAGMYTDSHAGPCPEPVWDLLEAVVPRTPHLAGITFEFHDSYYPLLQDEGIRRELARARDAWGRRIRP